MPRDARSFSRSLINRDRRSALRGVAGGRADLTWRSFFYFAGA
jgi:hypothetical protein